MAPEVMNGEPQTVESDIWAFGVLVWEIYNKAVMPYAAGLWTEPSIHFPTTHSAVDDASLHAYVAGGGRLAPERCSDATYKLLLQCWEPDAPLRMVCLWLHPRLPLISCCQQFDRIVTRIEELVWDVQYPSEDQPQRLCAWPVMCGFSRLIAGADRPRASYLDKLGDMPEFDMTPYMAPLEV